MLKNYSSAKNRDAIFCVSHTNTPFDHKNLAMAKFRRISGIIKGAISPYHAVATSICVGLFEAKPPVSQTNPVPRLV